MNMLLNGIWCAIEAIYRFPLGMEEPSQQPRYSMHGEALGRTVLLRPIDTQLLLLHLLLHRLVDMRRNGVRTDLRLSLLLVVVVVVVSSRTWGGQKVMSVVSEKVGGRRGKELVSPIVMEGAFAAIRRVQEARRKEILQVRGCARIEGGMQALYDPHSQVTFLSVHSDYSVSKSRFFPKVCDKTMSPDSKKQKNTKIRLAKGGSWDIQNTPFYLHATRRASRDGWRLLQSMPTWPLFLSLRCCDPPPSHPLSPSASPRR